MTLNEVLREGWMERLASIRNGMTLTLTHKQCQNLHELLKKSTVATPDRIMGDGNHWSEGSFGEGRRPGDDSIGGS